MQQNTIFVNSIWKRKNGPETVTVLAIFLQDNTLCAKWNDIEIDFTFSEEYFRNWFEEVKND